MKLRDAQKPVPLISMEDQDNDEDRHSVENDNNLDEPAQNMAWDFDDLQRSDHRVSWYYRLAATFVRSTM